MQYNREKNIEPDVLVGKIRGYWGGGKMFENMSCKLITSHIGMVYILQSA